MKRQRGFAVEAWMVWAVLGFGTLVGLLIGVQLYLAHIEKRGYERGVGEVRAEWNAAKLKAEEERKERDAAVAGALDTLAKKVAAAEAEADRNKTEWQEARNEARRNGRQLAACSKPAPRVAGEAGANPSSANDPAADSGGAVLFHWRFVGLYDGAHRGLDGKPLFAATAQHARAPERADTPSPYTPDDVIDVHGANADSWADCRRDLNAAIDKVEAAEQAWGRGQR
jgi:hypothetical protein